MMTVKRMFMLLFRTVIVWPSVLTGCLMMLYFVEVASGGVTGLAQRYEAESARWRDAPEGTVIMLRCPSRPFVTPVTTGSGVHSPPLTQNASGHRALSGRLQRQIFSHCTCWR